MTSTDEHIRQQAIDWALSTQEADFAGWDLLAVWLEADPRHNDAYDAALAASAVIPDLAALAQPAMLKPANDDQRPAALNMTRRRWIAGALAASVLAIIALPIMQMRPQPYTVATQMGETNTLELADGSRIVMNGGTRITLDRRDARFARLDVGEALFEVRHDASDPFVVESGDVRLVDAGTAFNVIRNAGSLDVAVSEGVVIVNPTRENVRLPAGRRAIVDGKTNRIAVSDIVPDAVGGWRSGQLSFADASLADVAAALERGLGAKIAVAPSIAARPFSGVVQISGRDAQAIASIAPVLGTRAIRRADGWELIDTDANP